MEPEAIKKKACASCTKAKAKCTPVQGIEACERCTRLGRDCVFDDVVRRRKRRNVTRMARLEERVEDLLGLLSQRNQSSDSGNVGQTAPKLTASQQALEIPTPETATNSESGSRKEGTAGPSYGAGHGASHGAGYGTRSSTVVHYEEPELPNRPDIVDSGLLGLREADEMLEKYRAVKTPHFPFVVLPPDADADYLRRNSPFLFLTVMSACYESDLKMQHRLRSEIKQEICRRLIMNEERSLDLLQGLLVHICWCHYHVSPKRKQMFLLNQMALTIVIDLGLDRSNYNFSIRVGVDVEKIASQTSSTCGLEHERRPNAELRAFLGCYYLCSIMALFRRSTFMRHSRWVDDCWKILEEAQEFPSDAWLRHFVATRHLAQRIIESLSLDDHLEQGNTRNPALLEMTMKGFRQEVEQLEQSILSSTAHICKGLLLEVKSLVATIYEVAVCYKPNLSGPSSSLHATHLWNLLTSCRTLLQAQIDISPETLQNLTLPTFKMVWYGFMLLIKFDVIPSSHSWDREMAQREAMVDELGQQVLNLLDQLWDPSRGESVWSHYSRGMQTMLRWHRERLKTAANEAEAERSASTDHSQPPASHLFGPNGPAPNMANLSPGGSTSIPPRNHPGSLHQQQQQQPSPESLATSVPSQGTPRSALSFFTTNVPPAAASAPTPPDAALAGAFDGPAAGDPMATDLGMMPTDTMWRRFIDDFGTPGSTMQTMGFYDPNGFAPFG